MLIPDKNENSSKKTDNESVFQKVSSINSIGLRFGKIRRDYSVVLALIVLMLIFSFIAPYFLRFNNIMNILLQTSTIAIVAIGQGTLLLTGQLDLSIGANVTLCGMLSAYLMEYGGLNPWIALSIGVLTGLIVGLCNGLIFTRIGIPAFITTLAMQYVCKGIAKLITSTKTVAPLDTSIALLGRGYLFNVIPVSVAIMIAFYMLVAFVLSKTSSGRSVYAVGGNPEAAFFSGINTKKTYLLAFAFSGMCAGISAGILISRLNSANIGNGTGYEFEAMIGCVIGGISQQGGKGKIIGAMFGVMFSVALFNGMTLLNVNSFVQDLFKGLVLLIAMTYDVMKNKKSIVRS